MRGKEPPDPKNAFENKKEEERRELRFRDFSRGNGGVQVRLKSGEKISGKIASLIQEKSGRRKKKV